MKGRAAIERDVTVIRAADDSADPEDSARSHFQAVLTVEALPAQFRMTLPKAAVSLIDQRFSSHADRRVFKKWIAELSPGAGDGEWDAETELVVMFYLAIHVLSEWQDIPKRTKREHGKLYGDIVAAAETLQRLLKETGTDFIVGGGYGLDGAIVCQFFDHLESERTLGAIESWSKSQQEFYEDGSPVTYLPWENFPTVDVVLGRIANAAQTLQAAGTIHSQPKKRGAVNGYFTRRMSELLQLRYGTCPDAVLAALASIALGEVVDPELAKKNRKSAERSERKK